MQGSFFDRTFEDNQAANEPLAARMRPETLAHFYGQDQIVGRGKL